MVVELHPQTLDQLPGGLPVEIAIGHTTLIERLQMLIEVAGVVGVPTVELGDHPEVGKPIGLHGLPEVPRGVGGNPAANLGDTHELGPPLRVAFGLRHLLGSLSVPLGKEDGGVRGNVHGLELVLLGQCGQVRAEVKIFDRGGDIGLEVEHALCEHLAVAYGVTGRPLFHELGEDAGRKRLMPLLRQLIKDPVTERAPRPERNDFPFVDLDVFGRDVIAGHRPGVENSKIVGAVTGDLGVGRRGLWLVAPLADDQLTIADVDGLRGAQVVEGPCPQHRLRELADVLPVEVSQEHRPFDRNRGVGVQAYLAQHPYAVVHEVPPTHTLRSWRASLSVTVPSVSASGGRRPTRSPVAPRRDSLPFAVP